MFNFEKINLSLSFSPLLFIFGLLLIVGYSVYIYRYTVPEVSTPYRLFLTALRSLALLLLLFIIFEPILNITKRNNITPVSLIFVDDSKSIQIQDGTNRKEIVKDFINGTGKSSIASKARFFSFGRNVNKVPVDSLGNLSFNESSTNYSNVFNLQDLTEQNISSIVFVSDGVITDGSNPIYTAEKLGIPIYTLGVGDTTKNNNLEIRKVLFNEYIYAGTPTAINMILLNTGFKDSKVTAALYEEGVQVDKKDITLSSDGTSNVNFNYTPKTAGERKLTLTVSNLKDELTYADNKKILYIRVLDSKLNTLVIAGSPSPDLSFIRNSLASDENLRVSTVTQVSSNKFLEKVDPNRAIDSANVLFLVGFPSSQTPASLLNKVISTIKTKNIPYFFILSASTDLNKLRSLETELPFNIQRVSNGFSEVQPYIPPNELQNTLVQNSSGNPDIWDNMPPVSRSNSEFSAKPESEVIARIKINNIPINSPLILTRKLGNKRSAAVLAKDIWRWKLQTAEKKIDAYDRLFVNSVKWLNTKEDQKMVTIKTSKKLYSLGEPIDFTAQVYDDTFNPVEDAEVTVNVSSGKDKYQLTMNSLGSGLYEGSLSANNPGDYLFSGSAKSNNKTLGNDNGKFSIGDVEIELINPRMDKDFLTSLSTQTKGKFFYGPNYKQLIQTLEQISEKKTQGKLIKSEITLWSNKWMLVAVILLFAIEWFLRKRSGML